MNNKAMARAKTLKDMPTRYHKLFYKAWKGKNTEVAIEAFCLQCVCFQTAEITNCTSYACPLFEFRKI